MTPQTNTNNLNANMATILIILACAAILGFSLHAVVRLLIRLLAVHSSTKSKNENDASTNEPSSSPVIFSSETRLSRAEPECVICLSEFVHGERLRVLPSCGHGFHANCVEEWIVKHSSCPTCRAKCSLALVLPEEP